VSDTPDEPIQSTISRRVEGIVMSVLDYADEVMRNGSPKAKADFIKQVLPTLVKSLQTEEVDSDIERLKANQEKIFEALMDAEPPAHLLVPRPKIPDVPTDDAPGG
jgi:hypothetical protein